MMSSRIAITTPPADIPTITGSVKKEASWVGEGEVFHDIGTELNVQYQGIKPVNILLGYSLKFKQFEALLSV